MTVLLHPPTRISFEGDLADADRQRIEKALREAVERALEKAAAASQEIVAPIGPVELPDEPFDPARFDPAGAYQIPSYDDQGQLTAVQLLEGMPTAMPGVMVFDGPGPLPHALIISMPGNRYVNLDSPRYVSAGTLTEALVLGTAVHATTAFAIVQGPWGSPKMRYLALGSERPVSDSDLGEAATAADVAGEALIPPELVGKTKTVLGERMEGTLRGTDGEYLVRGFVTSDRIPHWRGAPMAALWFAQLEAEQQKGFTPQPEIYRVLIFDDIDALVEQIEAGDTTNIQHVAEMLSRLDAQAFSLVDWEGKVAYLKVLLAAWTWEEEEKAVVEIFKSLNDDTEVDAVVDMLKSAGRYNQLFNDLDSQLYELLVVVGQKFPRDHGPLGLEGLVGLFESMGLIPKTALGALTGLEEGPDGTIVPPEVLDQAQELAMGFVRFGSDLGESILTIFTEPGKVVQGIGALGQLLVKVELASLGYVPAIVELNRLLVELGEKVLQGMRGADRLGAGEKVVRRIKWRLVWEITSLFVGVGEIKAATQAVGLSEKLAGVVRFLGVLARLGEAADAEVEGARLARLAAVLKAERSAFKSVDEVAELLSHLAENDARKLGKVLSRFEVKEGETLADLAARSPELHGVATDSLTKAELLHGMAEKAGGLTEEIAKAFRTLVGTDGLEVASAQRVVRAIPQGEGARFAAALKRIPIGRLAADSRAAVLELVAGSTRRMDAVAKLGFETFSSVSRRVAGKAEELDRYLGALDQLESEFGAQGRRAEYRRLLDRLERDEPAAWLQLENERRLQAGERPIGAWAEQLAGSPKAQRALDRLLRRHGESVVDRLIDDLAGDLGLISDREVVMALEKIDELGERELDGVLELQRYMDRGGNFPQWDELLFAEPAQRRHLFEAIADLRDPANPGHLVVRDGLDEALKDALINAQGPMTGGFGHFEAARGLLREFPGVRMRFEFSRYTAAGRRDIDIILEFGGREVDVEIKGYQAVDVRSRIQHVRRQIRKDLLNHVGDADGPWASVLWRFPDPAFSGHLTTVEEVFIEQLRALSAEGLLTVPLPQAEAALRARFAASPPWRLIDVLH